jgi:hypothetical protein
LNITEELFKEKEKNRSALTYAESELSRINAFLEQHLSLEA